MPSIDKLIEDIRLEREELRRWLRFACLVMNEGNDRQLGAAIKALEEYLKTGRVIFEGRPDSPINRYLFDRWMMAEKE